MGLGRPLCVGGEDVGFSGSAYVKAICRALECRPQAVYIIDCPLCPEDEQGQMELNPQSKRYWCATCGRDGTLQSLLAIAEGLFASRHRESMELMETRPRVERGGTRR